MAIQRAVSYITYAKSSKERTRDTTTFTKFEWDNLLSEICNNTERGKKSDDDSTLSPLSSE